MKTALLALFLLPATALAEPLPFNQKVEVYRDKEGGVMVFALRLEQPFLAEEFEKSNYLRLGSLDRNSYLIYPKETKFKKKHAEFYGRLRGTGPTKLRLSYEIVSENLDGSRKVVVRHADIEVKIPKAELGAEGIYRQWAQKQNAHFAQLLEYYPDETFFQYVLLQSKKRYGVTPPSYRKTVRSAAQIETDLYHTFSGGLAVQQSLQQQTLRGKSDVGELNRHISRLEPPQLQSLNYKQLLKKKRDEEGIEPRIHEMSKLVPADQYFLHFKSMHAAGELFDLSRQWGDSLLRLYTITARDAHPQTKLEEQLCLKRGQITKLFEDVVVSEVAFSGSDMFLAEGSDLTVIFRLKQPDIFQKAADGWLTDIRKEHPALIEREFNYRGHKVKARYTNDRIVSSFVVTHDEYVIYSNSHVAVRKVIDTAIGITPNLGSSLDYRYLTTILPPSGDRAAGYLFASEAFLKRLVSPAFKISEKRRLQCFNNLVMLNNAALFYRLEHGKSPGSLSDLIEGRFIDPDKLVCSHGGAYAFDVEHDTGTCSLHNRIKYLTPNAELEVLRVSSQEQKQYERYTKRYQAFWQQVYDPIAARITVGSRIKMELAVLPFANSSIYGDLKGFLDSKSQPIDTARISPTAVASLAAVPGRERVAKFLRQLPGVPEVLEADPTLTDLSWVGDQISIHFCDDDTVLEIDPTKLRTLNIFGQTSVLQQTFAATAIAATNLPVYVTLDVENEQKAARLLENLAARVFLKRSSFVGLNTNLDAYQLPDYKNHKMYVLSFQLYAAKVRLYVALVRDQLVAATKPNTLKEVIDASAVEGADDLPQAHLLLRFNHRALNKLHDQLQIYWAEKSRQACHRNVMPVYNLVKLYDVPAEQVDRISDAKYGVTYFCPDHGKYHYHAAGDRVECTVHGNRQHARQTLQVGVDSPFSRIIKRIDQVTATLRFRDEALITTVEIVRSPKAKP